MSNRFLCEEFAAWREQGRDMVLATVIETAGSTYSKAGRQLLLDAAGRYAGLVGGGCLEGDLILRAREVLAANTARQVSYDMRDDADDLWGMGSGCRGLMTLLLQPLTAANDWQPFAALAEAMRGTRPGVAALVVTSNLAERQPGALELLADELSGLPRLDTTATPAGQFTALRWRVTPWPRLLILGAGPDAHPLVSMARTLGWEVWVADHRVELLDAAGLAAADRRIALERQEIDAKINPADFAAVCVMTHNLENDQQYLQTLSTHELPYVGVLGPAARRAELLARLGLENTAFAARLRGPVGLDIGADSPQTIALALLAEIQATLAAGWQNAGTKRHD